MPEHLQQLMKELDRLLETQSQALERLIRSPCQDVLSQVTRYESRIEILLAEISAIRHRSKQQN